MSSEQCQEELKNKYYVSEKRAKLAVKAAEASMRAKSLLAPKDISLYVGIPFCPSRCSYCSFVSQSIAGATELIEPYLEKLIEEIYFTAKEMYFLGLKPTTLYIGGGTPTILNELQLERLLSVLNSILSSYHLWEYTIEAGRPDTITKEKLCIMKQFGVNRISINPQTMNDKVLERIGRKHSSKDVLKAFYLAREVGFQAINMDIIAGLEGDTPDSFAETVKRLLALQPENITVHTLAIKRGADISDRSIAYTERDKVSQMLEFAGQQLSHSGFFPYYLYRQKFMAGGFENIGWCQKGLESLYNIFMMEEMQTVIAFGAGGVTKLYTPSKTHIERCINPKYPYEYIHLIEKINASKKAALLQWAKEVFSGGEAKK